tara:strand:- start:2472 stop:2807 length:336 start_codon:yes stop_codon:yes gene_type:complete
VRIGQLTTPVTVKRATASRDSYGHDVLSYSDVYNPLMVSVTEDAQAMANDDADGRSRRTVAKFTAAWTADLDIQPRDRVEWDGDTYEVETFFNKLGLNKWVEFSAVRLDRG